MDRNAKYLAKKGLVAKPKEQKQGPNMILVGFDKYSLEEMLSWRGTEKEEDLVFASYRWPPRFREERSCSTRQMETFLEYVDWLSDFASNIVVSEDEVQRRKK